MQIAKVYNGESKKYSLATELGTSTVPVASLTTEPDAIYCAFLIGNGQETTEVHSTESSLQSANPLTFRTLYIGNMSLASQMHNVLFSMSQIIEGDFYLSVEVENVDGSMESRETNLLSFFSSSTLVNEEVNPLLSDLDIEMFASVSMNQSLYEVSVTAIKTKRSTRKVTGIELHSMNISCVDMACRFSSTTPQNMSSESFGTLCFSGELRQCLRIDNSWETVEWDNQIWRQVPGIISISVEEKTDFEQGIIYVNLTLEHVEDFTVSVVGEDSLETEFLKQYFSDNEIWHLVDFRLARQSLNSMMVSVIGSNNIAATCLSHCGYTPLEALTPEIFRFSHSPTESIDSVFVELEGEKIPADIVINLRELVCATVIAANATHYSCIIHGIIPGNHTVEVDFPEVGRASVTANMKVSFLPKIASLHTTPVDQAVGSLFGGLSVTIFGTGFGVEPMLLDVRINNITCQVLGAAIRNITCITPKEPSGIFSERIGVVFVNGFLAGAFDFANIPFATPLIFDVSPLLLPPTSTFLFTVNGERFLPFDEEDWSKIIILIGVNRCKLVSVPDDEQLTCESKEFPPGRYNLSVHIPSKGFATEGFFVESVFRVLHFQPKYISQRGNDEIWIKGIGFKFNNPEVSVRIGNTMCSLIFLNNTFIQCLTNPMEQIGEVGLRITRDNRINADCDVCSLTVIPTPHIVGRIKMVVPPLIFLDGNFYLASNQTIASLEASLIRQHDLSSSTVKFESVNQSELILRIPILTMGEYRLTMFFPVFRRMLFNVTEHLTTHSSFSVKGVLESALLNNHRKALTEVRMTGNLLNDGLRVIVAGNECVNVTHNSTQYSCFSFCKNCSALSSAGLLERHILLLPVAPVDFDKSTLLSCTSGRCALDQGYTSLGTAPLVTSLRGSAGILLRGVGSINVEITDSRLWQSVDPSTFIPKLGDREGRFIWETRFPDDPSKLFLVYEFADLPAGVSQFSMFIPGRGTVEFTDAVDVWFETILTVSTVKGNTSSNAGGLSVSVTGQGFAGSDLTRYKTEVFVCGFRSIDLFSTGNSITFITPSIDKLVSNSPKKMEGELFHSGCTSYSGLSRLKHCTIVGMDLFPAIYRVFSHGVMAFTSSAAQNLSGLEFIVESSTNGSHWTEASHPIRVTQGNVHFFRGLPLADNLSPFGLIRFRWLNGHQYSLKRLELHGIPAAPLGDSNTESTTCDFTLRVTQFVPFTDNRLILTRRLERTASLISYSARTTPEVISVEEVHKDFTTMTLETEVDNAVITKNVRLYLNEILCETTATSSKRFVSKCAVTQTRFSAVQVWIPYQGWASFALPHCKVIDEDMVVGSGFYLIKKENVPFAILPPSTYLKWSNIFEWNGREPENEDSFTIKRDEMVIIDVDEVRLEELHVYGILLISDEKAVDLQVGVINVYPGAFFATSFFVCPRTLPLRIGSKTKATQVSVQSGAVYLEAIPTSSYSISRHGNTTSSVDIQDSTSMAVGDEVFVTFSGCNGDTTECVSIDNISQINSKTVITLGSQLPSFMKASLSTLAGIITIYGDITVRDNSYFVVEGCLVRTPKTSQSSLSVTHHFNSQFSFTNGILFSDNRAIEVHESQNIRLGSNIILTPALIQSIHIRDPISSDVTVCDNIFHTYPAITDRQLFGSTFFSHSSALTMFGNRFTGVSFIGIELNLLAEQSLFPVERERYREFFLSNTILRNNAFADLVMLMASNSPMQGESTLHICNSSFSNSDHNVISRNFQNLALKNTEFASSLSSLRFTGTSSQFSCLLQKVNISSLSCNQVAVIIPSTSEMKLDNVRFPKSSQCAKASLALEKGNGLADVYRKGVMKRVEFGRTKWSSEEVIIQDATSSFASHIFPDINIPGWMSPPISYLEQSNECENVNELSLGAPTTQLCHSLIGEVQVDIIRGHQIRIQPAKIRRFIGPQGQLQFSSYSTVQPIRSGVSTQYKFTVTDNAAYDLRLGDQSWQEVVITGVREIRNNEGIYVTVQSRRALAYEVSVWRNERWESPPASSSLNPPAFSNGCGSVFRDVPRRTVGVAIVNNQNSLCQVKVTVTPCIGGSCFGSLSPGENARTERWSNDDTWRRTQKPSENATVIIGAQQVVMMDVMKTPILDNLIIYGVLFFQEDGSLSSYTLRSRALVVEGVLQVGAQTIPFSRKGNIELHGRHGVYTASLVVSGEMRLIGGAFSTDFAYSDGCVEEGSNQVTLDREVEWDHGDIIIIFDAKRGYNFTRQYTIQTVSSRVIQLQEALDVHPCDAAFSEVLNVRLLSKNVRLSAVCTGQNSHLGCSKIVSEGSAAVMRFQNTQVDRVGMTNLHRTFPAFRLNEQSILSLSEVIILNSYGAALESSSTSRCIIENSVIAFTQGDSIRFTETDVTTGELQITNTWIIATRGNPLQPENSNGLWLSVGANSYYVIKMTELSIIDSIDVGVHINEDTECRNKWLSQSFTRSVHVDGARVGWRVLSTNKRSGCLEVGKMTARQVLGTAVDVSTAHHFVQLSELSMRNITNGVRLRVPPAEPRMSIVLDSNVASDIGCCEHRSSFSRSLFFITEDRIISGHFRPDDFETELSQIRSIEFRNNSMISSTDLVWVYHVEASLTAVSEITISDYELKNNSMELRIIPFLNSFDVLPLNVIVNVTGKNPQILVHRSIASLLGQIGVGACKDEHHSLKVPDFWHCGNDVTVLSLLTRYDDKHSIVMHLKTCLLGNSLDFDESACMIFNMVRGYSQIVAPAGALTVFFPSHSFCSKWRYQIRMSVGCTRFVTISRYRDPLFMAARQVYPHIHSTARVSWNGWDQWLEVPSSCGVTIEVFPIPYVRLSMMIFTRMINSTETLLSNEFEVFMTDFFERVAGVYNSTARFIQMRGIPRGNWSRLLSELPPIERKHTVSPDGAILDIGFSPIMHQYNSTVAFGVTGRHELNELIGLLRSLLFAQHREDLTNQVKNSSQNIFAMLGTLDLQTYFRFMDFDVPTDETYFQCTQPCGEFQECVDRYCKCIPGYDRIHDTACVRSVATPSPTPTTTPTPSVTNTGTFTPTTTNAPDRVKDFVRGQAFVLFRLGLIGNGFDFWTTTQGIRILQQEIAESIDIGRRNSHLIRIAVQRDVAITDSWSGQFAPHCAESTKNMDSQSSAFHIEFVVPTVLTQAETNRHPPLSQFPSRPEIQVRLVQQQSTTNCGPYVSLIEALNDITENIEGKFINISLSRQIGGLVVAKVEEEYDDSQVIDRPVPSTLPSVTPTRTSTSRPQDETSSGNTFAVRSGVLLMGGIAILVVLLLAGVALIARKIRRRHKHRTMVTPREVHLGMMTDRTLGIPAKNEYGVHMKKAASAKLLRARVEQNTEKPVTAGFRRKRSGN